MYSCCTSLTLAMRISTAPAARMRPRTPQGHLELIWHISQLHDDHRALQPRGDETSQRSSALPKIVNRAQVTR